MTSYWYDVRTGRQTEASTKPERSLSSYRHFRFQKKKSLNIDLAVIYIIITKHTLLILVLPDVATAHKPLSFISYVSDLLLLLDVDPSRSLYLEKVR